MHIKLPLLSLGLILILLLSGTCFAAPEKPIGDITSTQQVIDKLFSGRTLDPIEGIWVRDENRVIAIVKSSVAYPDEKIQKYDYLAIKVSGKWQSMGGVWSGFTRTEYNFSFKGGNVYWKLLSQNLLEQGIEYNYPVTPSETFVRIYPNQ
ncbi:hypothetical protein [Sporomusa malonica]|uniref:Uncharacterized protein n=1 Tax=Sporomusa malonica TaxID=112901 RepID=A0A1W2EXT5_9FIRM|nr:hypothetical protein [Sporomusa malonica]SMD14491.1 hypothetical protein SAMN04488500_1342 [Sporomusa malonica]